MAVDVTGTFKEHVKRACAAPGVSDAARKEVANALLLRKRSVRRTLFGSKVVEASKQFRDARKLIDSRRDDFMLPGRLPEEARDQIEEEVGLLLRALGKGLEVLQRDVDVPGLEAPDGAPEARSGPKSKRHVISAHEKAHRQGVILILSEELRSLSALFDTWRAQRMQQKKSSKRRGAGAKFDVKPSGARSEHANQELHLTETRAPEMPAGNDGQAQMLQAENDLLVEEMRAQGAQIAQAEASLRDVAALSQAFSEQLVTQSEQIEQLYYEAVAATRMLEKGAENLDKTLKITKRGTWWLFLFMMFMSAFVLAADFWYS
ncbi:unnamed protein product [Pedinophyceae sp. YPF-701]|nr:unnamed protein product [Pedinophyceae sp. YPF-701]